MHDSPWSGEAMNAAAGDDGDDETVCGTWVDCEDYSNSSDARSGKDPVQRAALPLQSGWAVLLRTHEMRSFFSLS